MNTPDSNAEKKRPTDPTYSQSSSARGSVAHVRRLQEQNRLLAECLADERRMRKDAYKWYHRRLQSRVMWMIDVLVIGLRH